MGMCGASDRAVEFCASNEGPLHLLAYGFQIGLFVTDAESSLVFFSSSSSLAHLAVDDQSVAS